MILAQTQTTPQTQTAPQTQTQPEPPPPSSDIFVLDLSVKDGSLQVGKATNLTHRKGYDNQPSFFFDDEIFYTSIRDGQADIYAFNLRTKRFRQMTKTPESEYSPSLTPDQKFFSVVRVEADKTQRLWKFPIDAGAPTLVLPNVKQVGYHLWAGEDIVLLYILGEPPSLQFAKVSIGKVQRLTDNIGRCFQLVPESSDASFVQKNEHDQWWIYRMDAKTLEKTPITKALQTEEYDFTWMPDGTVLMAQGPQLYRIKPDSEQDWTLVADLSEQSINGITRLAVNHSGTKLALVAADQ
jgi:Tol biopolymer transport system component